MAGRTGRLLAFFARAEPRGAPASGWALALDAALAVGAAAGAVYEVATSGIDATRVVSPNLVTLSPAGVILVPARHLGGVLLTTQVPGHMPYDAMAAAAMTALPLAVRRVYPISAWLAVAIAILVIHRVYLPPVALGTAIFAAYSAVTHSRYRNLAIAAVTVVTVIVAGALGNGLPRFPGRLTAVFAVLPAGLAGLGIRVLRRRLADSTARLSRAADEARAATERALAAERARIASELHDVVTHNVSVMIVQAGAARKIMASSPADAEDALLAVEATGREAMTELRNLLGLLSPAGDGTAGDGDPGVSLGAGFGAGGGARPGAGPATRAPVAAALRPQPGLGELDGLIRRVSAAGLPVTLAVRGEPRPLPPGAGLAAYRVAQEGLTNVLRHAGAGSATVAVDWGETLQITVGDDGPGGPGGAGPGRGLLGLRERLALYGGELEAGPRPGPEGGWRVRAVLPLTGRALAGARADADAGTGAGPEAGAGAEVNAVAGTGAGPEANAGANANAGAPEANAPGGGG